MELSKVSANTRTAGGKGIARRLRASGQIPAVAYGKGRAARSLAVSPEEVVNVLQSELGANSLIELEVEGKEKLNVLLGEYQYHPVTRRLLHADFIEVDVNDPVEVKVPLELTGKAQGIVMGGKLRQIYREIPVRCVPGKIPAKVTHDITELQIEEHVAAADIQLPEGVEICLPAKKTVATIASDRRAKGEEGEGEAEKKK
jgi:large subunit ribosomal protein L25